MKINFLLKDYKLTFRLEKIRLLKVKKIVNNLIKDELLDNPTIEIEDINVSKAKFLEGIFNYINNVMYFNLKIIYLTLLNREI